MTNNKYSFTAIFFHWFLAIVIFTLLASGFYMADLPFSMQKLKLMDSYHFKLFYEESFFNPFKVAI